MYRNILIATDGSDLAASAVKHGVSLAKSLAAKVTAVNVSEPFHWYDPNMVASAAIHAAGSASASQVWKYRSGSKTNHSAQVIG